MNSQTYLKHQFLLAMPNISDPNFSRSVTYICEHNEQGAMGVIINRPLDLHFVTILRHIQIECDDPTVNSRAILWGGPVNPEQVFILHTPEGSWDSTMSTEKGLAITTSRDILEATADGEGPHKSLIALGYSGWSAGQLESELAANMWLNGPATQQVLFDVDFSHRYEAAAEAMGFDLNSLSTDIGHA